MRIDAYTHFIPEKYFNKIVESGHADIGKRVREIPCIHDLEVRRRIVDSFKDYAQIISVIFLLWVGPGWLSIDRFLFGKTNKR